MQSPPRYTPQDLDRWLEISPVWQRGYRGAGVTVAVADTGVIDDPELGSALLETHDLAGGGAGAIHGTQIARLVHQVAPEAKIASFTVFPSEDRRLWFRRNALVRRCVTETLERCIAEFPRVRVVNLSLAIPRGYVFVRCRREQLCEMCQAVNRAAEANIVVVAAAGNTGPEPDTIECPGLAQGAITVGATVPMEQDAYFAAGGKPEDLGTSFSSAYITGGVALLLSACPDASVEELRVALTQGARPIQGVVRNAQGAGMANFARSLEILVGPSAEAYHAARQQLYYLAGNADAQREDNHYVTAPLDVSLAYIEKSLIRRGLRPAAAKESEELKQVLVPGRMPTYERAIETLARRCLGMPEGTAPTVSAGP